MVDTNYPMIHIRPPKNHINDPNGLIYYKGTYHLFMQYNPAGAVWGKIHWAHLSTTDFINWDQHPIALTPDKYYDREGCWSGCAFQTEQGPAIIYSAYDGKKTLPALAFGNENLTIWEKVTENPIIKEWPLKGLFGFRDHKIIKKQNGWIQLIGSGLPGKGLILYYTSQDLLHWAYKGIWYTFKHDSENMLECPDYITINNKKIIIFSTNNPHTDQTLQSYWALGEELEENENIKFLSNKKELIDPGCFYAPQTLFDGTRTILVGWLREERSNEELNKAGWAGALSLPRELKEEENQLLMYPLEELKNLRVVKLESVINSGRKDERIIKIDNGLLECIITGPHLQLNDKLQIKICNNERTKSVNLTISDSDFKLFSEDHEINEFSCKLEKVRSEYSTIHVFIDHSIIEIFINYRLTISKRIYDLGENLEILITTTRMSEITAYQLKSLSYKEATI